jgi:hypothetical protein
MRSTPERERCGSKKGRSALSPRRTVDLGVIASQKSYDVVTLDTHDLPKAPPEGSTVLVSRYDRGVPLANKVDVKNLGTDDMPFLAA